MNDCHNHNGDPRKTDKSGPGDHVAPEGTAPNEEHEDLEARFGTWSDEELRDYYRRIVAEDDAVDLQCLIDGHSDRDRAAAKRDQLEIERHIAALLRAALEHSESPEAFSLEEARRVVRERIKDSVPDDVVWAQYNKL